jgi:Protein of unknown function (DUF2846)
MCRRRPPPRERHCLPLFLSQLILLNYVRGVPTSLRAARTNFPDRPNIFPKELKAMNSFVRSLAAISLLLLAAPAPFAQDQTQSAPPAPTAAAEATPAAPARAEGKAVVFVYRPGKFVGRALEPSVFCDGVEVARMDNGRYFVLLLEPGEHRVHTTEEYKRIDLKLGAGEVAFVRFRLESGMMKGRGNLYLADEADAFKDIRKAKPLGADKFKDTKLAVVDRAEAEALLKKYVR